MPVPRNPGFLNAGRIVCVEPRGSRGWLRDLGSPVLTWTGACQLVVENDHPSLCLKYKFFVL